jgi:carbohydrate diacid regulator
MKFFQNLVNQVREIINHEFGITDETGLILACSNQEKVGRNYPLALKAAESKKRFSVLGGVSFQKVYVRNKLEFVTFINSDSEDSRKVLSLISINVTNIRVYHEEKFDKNNFIKNIILDNVLLGDIPLRAKGLRISYDAYRVVLLIKTEKSKDTHPYQVVQSLFPNKAKDFIVVLDDETTVLVKELKAGYDVKIIDRMAKMIVNTLNTELMVKAYVGIGSVVDNILDVGRSFNEAQTALKVGGIFDSDKLIVDYNNLGIGRLIYQLPVTLCKLFLKEVFDGDSFNNMDTETILTIQKFFENNLNVSETSRQLYIHRNTLVYRLDKIQRLTGLDIRKFDDAIIFKVSMLVKKYLDKSKETGI